MFNRFADTVAKNIVLVTVGNCFRYTSFIAQASLKVVDLLYDNTELNFKINKLAHLILNVF